MATSKTTRMDAQGRVIIPPHIRKELDLNAGQKVTVSLEAGVIQICPAEERCAFCGRAVNDDLPFGSVTGVLICRSCAEEIAEALKIADAVK